MKKTLMAILSHADDIELKLGGTLLKYHAAGYEIVYVMATNNMSGTADVLMPDGTHKKLKETPDLMMKRRKGECDTSAKMLGTVPVHLDHPQRHFWDGKKTVQIGYGSPAPLGISSDIPPIIIAHEDEESVDRVANLIIDKNPECIFTHSVAQVDVEHFCTSLLVTKAYWKAVEKGLKGSLLYCREHHNNLGDLNCRWETFVDYTRFLDEKMKLIGMHRCQMPNAMSPDFAHRILAKRWGTACACGAAEPFYWCRRPEKIEADQPTYGALTLELINNSR